jgi:hypothetical protein
MPSVQEKDRRFAALRTLMRAQGYQALVLSGNAEATQRGYIRYVADWRLWGGKGFVVLPLEGEPLLGSDGAGGWGSGGRSGAWN